MLKITALTAARSRIFQLHLSHPAAVMGANDIRFFDLEEAVLDWANLMYDRNARSRKQRRLKRKHFVENQPCLDIEIDWSRLSISHKTVWGPIVDDDFGEPVGPKSGSAATAATSNGSRGAAEAPCLKPNEVKNVAANVLFKTDFSNDTDERQEYCMKVEKTTRSSCTTEIENGLVKGAELSATLNIGDVLEVGAAFTREVSLSKIEGETIEQEMTWAAESTIVVPPHRAATAEMVVLEKQQTGDFVVLTTVRGTVLVRYNSLNDNSLLFSQSGKIHYVIGEYLKQVRSLGKAFRGIDVNKEQGTVIFQTKGRCTFRFGIKQMVRVNQDKKSV
ncbi:hypothetical protein LSH36_396g01008 [Paralvinella palmiformis]|uniref:Uncharacterized protein n=1 Tax=Paralvinella palmiformis TaxID=53620 RepID=A0AAD9N1D8_9ANNE|nr:hypothetical protein LSH36_396g01008 [Paralvinella palmiformis]